MTKQDFNNTLRLQCLDVKPLSMEQFDRSCASARKLLEGFNAKAVRRIVATGCGDSFLAAAEAKDAFAKYLPDVKYEAPTGIEAGRYIAFKEKEANTLVVAISVSGGPSRVAEVLERAKYHGCTAVALTDNPDSRAAETASLLYHTNTPKGDNLSGLRTYYVSMISLYVLAALMAEARTGMPCVDELRAQVNAYVSAFYQKIGTMDDIAFETAVSWKEKKTFEVTADGPLFACGKFIAAKLAELSGDACAVIDSENFFHVNSLMYPGRDIGELVLIDSSAPNVNRIAETVNAQVKRSGRDVLVFCDRAPEDIGITEKVTACPLPMPAEGWHFLAPLLAYLPAAIFASYRAKAIDEPFFRAGRTRVGMTLGTNPVRII